jgi:hypothetical protein
MSTKTTFKRIALVTVAALGFGVLTTVAPANAAATSLSAASSSYTVVKSSSTGFAIVPLTVSGAAAAALVDGAETITATTIITPNQYESTTAASGLTFQGVTVAADGTVAAQTLASGAATAVNSGNIVADGTTAPAVNNPFDSTDTTADGAGVYFVKVVLPANAATAAGSAGFYTVRFDITDGTYRLASTSVKFRLVQNAADISGATVSVSSAATSIASGTAIGGVAGGTATKVTVTTTDGNSGRIIDGSTGLPLAPRVRLQDSATTFVAATSVVDDGGKNLATPSTTSVDSTYADGVWSARWTAVGNTASAYASGKIVADYPGNATATGSAAIVIVAAASGTATAYMSATGEYKASTDAIAHDIPLTTKSVTSYVVDGALTTGKAYFYSVTYTGCVAADMSITASTLTKVLTDATGVASVTLTNANPIAGCSAVITWSGATMTRAAHTANWAAATPTTVVKSPGGSFQALQKSTNKLTWTILDQFGAPVVGKTATFTMSGANAPTAGLPSQVTDANGQVTVTLVDALADATTTSDTVLINKVGTTTLDAGSLTITYKTALSVVASLYSTYTTTVVTSATLIPTATNIGGTAGLLVSANDQVDTTKAISTATADALVGAAKISFVAKTSADVTVTGVPTTVTVTDGYLLDSAGKLATSRVLYANEAVNIVGTKTGLVTVTAVNGTVTATTKVYFVNAAADARVLKLTEAAGLVTASVTDAFGNAVAGVKVDVAGSGGAWLGNGATSAQFLTAADGTVTFSVTGSGSVTATINSTDYAKASFLANAGNATGTVVTTGAPAGVRTVTVATTGNNVVADSAQAAADAAAEATDAANAATDAANAAAEAADAATAAAQDSADAVAALSTQVSEMISALKKQITALTNLVIKIQKKVKA